MMAQILVRGLDDGTVKRLKQRAKANGRSLEAEVRLVLEESAKVSMAEARELLAEFRKRFGGRKFSDSADLIREARGQ